MRAYICWFLFLLVGCNDEPRARYEAEADMNVAPDTQVVDQGVEDSNVMTDMNAVVEPDAAAPVEDAAPPTDPPSPADGDADGVADGDDNCPEHANPDQADFDVDGVGDVCDNCVANANPNQEDSDDAHPAGDACQHLGEDNDGDCYCEGLPRLGGPPGCIGDFGECENLLGIADCDDSDASVYQLQIDENGERCGSAGRILEVSWTPGTAVLGRETINGGIIFEPWQFEIPAEVERLVPWISCWSENQGLDENDYRTQFTVWRLGQEINLAEVDELPEIRLNLTIPDGEVRTISCEWNVHGLCAGQELPDPNAPIFIGGRNGWHDFCWSSISRPSEFHLLEQGEHFYRWISPPTNPVRTAYGSFWGPLVRGFVPVMPDQDRDDVPDDLDNCPEEENSFQEDSNLDGVGDACDNDW